jgi:hypothetical protein
MGSTRMVVTPLLNRMRTNSDPSSPNSHPNLNLNNRRTWLTESALWKTSGCP